MRNLLWLACASLALGAAAAADKPIIAPPANWVRPTPLPTDDGKLGEAAVRIVLQDQQVRLTPGGDDFYVETAVRIQTPQGLAAMGTISLPWKPETMTLTVHKLHVIRGGKVIDLLTDGHDFTVLRRENSLEYAVLDGVLTATIQPEGLQVGDILDSAFTIHNADPAVKGLSQGALGGWPGVPIDHVRSRAIWPTGAPVRWRVTGGLPPIKEQRQGDATEIALAIDNLQPIVPPKGAPARYAITRTIELTSATGWEQVSSLFAPLYAKASAIRPGSPLDAEVQRIRAASPEPVRRAELALALAQDQVRYVFLGMNDGNLVPADAAQTWARRFGDCKGKTALLLALLQALDIEAEPAMVSSRLGDGLDQRLPTVGAFDHILVRATIGGKIFWLDGTRTGDRRLQDIDVPPFRWALPVRSPGTTLVKLEVQPPATPLVMTDIRIDASKGLSAPAPAHVERVLRGDDATRLKLAVANLAPDARERELKEFWKGQYDFIDASKVDARYDEQTGEERLILDGVAKLDWTGRHYEADGSAIGYDADFTRDPASDRDAPFAVAFPHYAVVKETIQLPEGGKPFRVTAPDINTVAAGTEYKRRGRIENGAFVAETSTRSIAPEFAARDAPIAQATIRGFKKVGLYVEMLPNYKGEVASVAPVTDPKTADDFLRRGAQRATSADWAGARVDFEKAVAIEPGNANALAALAMLDLGQKNAQAALANADRALAIDPMNAVAAKTRAALEVDRDPTQAIRHATIAIDRNPNEGLALAVRSRAYLAQGDYKSALADAERLVQVAPENPAAYFARASARQRLGETDKALLDFDAVLRREPRMIDAYLGRMNALGTSQHPDQVRATLTAMLAANADDGYAHVIAGATYARLGDREASDKAFARSIEIKPTTEAYLTRANNRRASDHAGRLSDAQAALALAPTFDEALAMVANEQAATGDNRGALATLDRLKNDRSTAWVETQRAIAFVHLGDETSADKAIAAARAADPSPTQLNNLCWTLATAGARLKDALAACDAAVARDPKIAAFLDSRGFVLLRLGRYEEAVAAYDAALVERPNDAKSLYGRGLAKLRIGDRAGGDADVAAAKVVDPRVVERFIDYGVTA